MAIRDATRPAWARRWSYVVIAVILVTVGSGAVLTSAVPFRVLREPVSAYFPREAVERLDRSGVTGRVLASFDWSGYLEWTSWPRVRPFIDPRMLDDATLRPYTQMIWATPEGMERFDREDFAAVLLPFVSPTGDVYELHRVLHARSDWAVEFVWPQGVLYRRVR